jgi:hypothetical protein
MQHFSGRFFLFRWATPDFSTPERAGHMQTSARKHFAK